MAKRYYEDDRLTFEEQQFVAGFYQETSPTKTILDSLPLLLPIAFSGIAFMMLAVGGEAVPAWLTNLGSFFAWMFLLGCFIACVSFAFLNHHLGDTRLKYLSNNLDEKDRKKFEDLVTSNISEPQPHPSMGLFLKRFRRIAIWISVIGLVMAGHFFVAFFITICCVFFSSIHKEYGKQLLDSIKAIAAKSSASV